MLFAYELKWEIIMNHIGQMQYFKKTMNTNKALQLIGSKWFVLALSVVMLLVLPTTYSNLMIVYEAGEMARVWMVPTVFVMNLLAAIMAIYKTTGMFFTKKDDQDWEDEED